MDYKERTILKDEGGYYRMYNEERVDTNVNGDVIIEVSKEMFDSNVAEDVKQLVEGFHPSLIPVTTIRSVLPPNQVLYEDDNVVVFRSGIMNKIAEGVYQRPKHPSDGEFAFWMSLVYSDKSNIYTEELFNNKYPQNVEK